MQKFWNNQTILPFKVIFNNIYKLKDISNDSYN